MERELGAILLAFASAPAFQDASDARKKEFIELLQKLPPKGEFYTEEAAAGPALTCPPCSP